MTKTLKVGVIGVGGIARSHMPGWKASEHAEVVAGSDLFEGALQHWGAVNDVKQLSTNAADIINDPDIDITYRHGRDNHPWFGFLHVSLPYRLHSSHQYVI